MVVDSARRRVVTDVSLSRRLASTQCFRRRRATSACSARRTLAAYLSSAVCGAVLAEPHARRPMNPLGLPRTCHGSLSEVPPSGPNPREVDLPQLSPWTLACAHPPDAWRLSLVFVSVLCVWGFRPPVCAAPGLPGRGATSSLLLSNIFFQLLYGVVLWWSTLLVVGW